ncbi:MAG: HNH endonuclease [Dehalococcoidia bacterium]|nr:HNH endonuclease [Dehalococcoidia bacterium]
MQPGDIVTHAEMCQAEGTMLQRGMTFRAPPHHGIILMSQMRGAPYRDALDADGQLLYEGHDVPRSDEHPFPKLVDQSRFSVRGRPTENGKFADWTDRFLRGEVPPARFHVYEKLRSGIWTFRGPFLLKGYRYEQVDGRRVFRFQLAAIDEIGNDGEITEVVPLEELQSRQIPTSVKQEVYKRDKGRCVLCGSRDQLHFDHDLPFSKGGASATPANVRLLCARHNLSKGAKIE